MQTIAEPLKATLETLDALPTKPTTPSSLANWLQSDRSRAWWSKWIGLDTRHSETLRLLQSDVMSFCHGIWTCPRRRGPLEGRLLVLCGPNGTGKTHAAKGVYRWACKVGRTKTVISEEDAVRPVSAEFRYWPGLLDVMRSGDWQACEPLFGADVVVIDDIGAAHDPSKFGMDKLGQLISARENHWTLLTTNIVPAAWPVDFDQRIASRLCRNATVIDLCDVPDYSTVKALQGRS